MPAVLHRSSPLPRRAAEMDLRQARELVLEAVAPLPSEPVALDEALGRVLAQDVLAERPLPAFDSSAMDGYAVRAADVSRAPARLRVVGESRAGRPAAVAIGEGEAIAISTGAVLPGGADAVVRVERTRRERGAPVVDVLDAPAPGADVRRAGEDVPAGALALCGGERIGPAQLGLLAALGCIAPECARAPRVSLLLTGDELCDAADPTGPGGVIDSNGWALAALARTHGAQVIRHERVGDDVAATRAAIAAAQDADLLVTCGGVSVGAHDHVRGCLAALGAHELFWGLALKPGHPTWFGTLGERVVPVLALPGNPVSAMVVFTLLAGPALRRMRGEREPERRTARLDGGWRKPAGRAHALRCVLQARADGWRARPLAAQGSHVLSSIAAADVLAIVPAPASELPDGARVDIEPLAQCW